MSASDGKAAEAQSQPSSAQSQSEPCWIPTSKRALESTLSRTQSLQLQAQTQAQVQVAVGAAEARQA